ncbi:glycosyltransferase family 2 protein [Cohnella soli]|uniref:Glycosyltransferase family 2 protein n=1 Tax=Cohnella soli TaxID=425005 RepID=A0ABW0HZ98_9BACL
MAETRAAAVHGDSRVQNSHRSSKRSDRSGARSPSSIRRNRRVIRGAGKLAASIRARYRLGFGDGYREGVQSGIQSFPTLFDGTSIVIPTFNQLEMLRTCVNSIIENTDLPYEIIVVDNASEDGTDVYLRKLGGQVRYRVLETNRGFAGAINAGLMMAKGRTIMLLNNDTIATENWLDNMIDCLNSDDRIGMVGPITNYISGEQKVDVPYSKVEDMPAFARLNNHQDPSRWRKIERLAGFCLLFRRELFDSVGYFDEGYEIGNFEDDDYNIRVRLLGKSLVIAQDSFIHHFGSVSMKALGDRFQEVNDRNEFYFMDKWNNPYEWIPFAHEREAQTGEKIAHTGDYFPENVVVQGAGANYYWIEGGVRRGVEGTFSFPAVRVSQVDLRRWPVGEPIRAVEAEHRWHSTTVAKLPDGAFYYIEGTKARKLMSAAAMRMWNLHLKPQTEMTEEHLGGLEQGLPIIAPPLLKQLL